MMNCRSAEQTCFDVLLVERAFVQRVILHFLVCLKEHHDSKYKILPKISNDAWEAKI